MLPALIALTLAAAPAPGIVAARCTSPNGPGTDIAYDSRTRRIGVRGNGGMVYASLDPYGGFVARTALCRRIRPFTPKSNVPYLPAQTPSGDYAIGCIALGREYTLATTFILRHIAPATTVLVLTFSGSRALTATVTRSGARFLFSPLYCRPA